MGEDKAFAKINKEGNGKEERKRKQVRRCVAGMCVCQWLHTVSTLCKKTGKGTATVDNGPRDALQHFRDFGDGAAGVHTAVPRHRGVKHTQKRPKHRQKHTKETENRGKD